MHILNRDESRIMWKRGLKRRRLYFTFVDRNEFTIRQRNAHDCLWRRGFSVAARPFRFFLRFAHIYAFSRGSRAREQLRGTFVGKKNPPLFIEFTISRVSSRRDFHSPREPVRFSKLRLTRYVPPRLADTLCERSATTALCIIITV